VKAGQAAAITLRAAPAREFAGAVLAIGAVAHEVDLMADPTAVPGQRVFDVTVAIRERDPDLMRPGVEAEVQFVTERIPDVTYIPVSGVFDRHGAKAVYVARNGTFLPRQVKTGARNDKWVVITDGLKPGETVALSDPTRTGAG